MKGVISILVDEAINTEGCRCVRQHLINVGKQRDGQNGGQLQVASV